MATNSIVDYLSSKGQDSSYANRAKLAQAQGIQNYTGTAGQNTKLLELLSKPAPATVSSSSLQPNNQIAIPQNNVSQIPALPVVSQQQADVNNATTQNTQAEQGYNQANSDLQTLSNQLANKGTDTLALEQQQGIPQISQNVLDLQDLANQKALEANLTPYSLQGQGRGIPTQILRGQEALKQRQLQVEGIFANAQLQAAQGKLQLAQSQVDRAINLKYEPILAKIDAQKQILENNKYLLTRSDQKLATAKQNLLEQQKKDQEQKRDDDKEIQKMIMEATPFAPPSVIAKANELFKQGKPNTEVALSLGVYGKDYLSNKLLNEQINTQKSTQAKNYADIAKTKQETYDLVAAGKGGIPSKPLTESQAKDFGYAQRQDQANPIIQNLSTKIVTMNPVTFKTQMALASNPLTSGQASPEVRQYYQAAQNFITAKLRQESGATINPSEFDSAYATYLPFPGDDSSTLQQKKNTRDLVTKSLKTNIPGYDARVSSQVTIEDKYLDGVALPAIGVVEQKTSPVSLYTSRLLGLPGVK